MQKKEPSPKRKEAKINEYHARDIIASRYIKGRPQPAIRGAAASMTVEAAIVLPLFLFFFLNLMSAIEMIRLHGKLEMALWEEGRLLAVAGYLTDGQGKIDWNQETTENSLLKPGLSMLADYGVKSMVIQDLGREYLENSPLTYGAEGLRFLESTYMDADCIDIKVTYQVSPMFQVPGFRKFRMANRYFARAWTGYRVADKARDIVYVTAYGEVYHGRLDCRYLKRVIEKVSVHEAEYRRNQSGERYQQCMLCIDTQSKTESYYITPNGECYHETIQCPALKRTIEEVERQEAQQKYRACSSCVSE